MCFGSSKPQQTQTESRTSVTKAHPVVEGAASDLIGGTMGLVLGSQWDPRTGKQIAGFSDPQLQAFADINQGIAQPYIDAAANAASWGSTPLSGETIASYYNPYLNDVINATRADFDRSNARQMGQVVGNARIAGSLGGDREAVVKALTAREQAATQNPIIANMRQQGYNTAAGLAQADAARALQGSGVLQNLANTAGLDTMWRLQSGQLQQGLSQAQLDALAQNAAAQGAFDWQKYLTGAGIVSGLGGVMGSTTNSTGTSTMTGPAPNYLSQALGLGIASAPYWGSIASGVGSAATGLASALPFLAAASGGRIQRAAGGNIPLGSVPGNPDLSPPATSPTAPWASPTYNGPAPAGIDLGASPNPNVPTGLATPTSPVAPFTTPPDPIPAPALSPTYNGPAPGFYGPMSLPATPNATPQPIVNGPAPSSPNGGVNPASFVSNTNTPDQPFRLTSPGLPYLASGGRASRDTLSTHMDDIARAARSGRQAMAAGGTPSGFYIPTAALPSGHLSAAPLMPMGGAGGGGGNTGPAPSGGFGDGVMAGIKSGEAVFKGLGGLGKALNTTKGPGGWETSVDYGNPLTNFTSGVSNGMSRLGSWFGGLGWAAGGGVDEDPPPLSGVEIVTAQPNLGVGLPVDSANPQTELRRRLDATPVPMPITDMPRIRDVPNEGQLVPTAGVAVPPPSITGDAVGSPGNPTGGVGVRPSPTPPPKGAFDDLGNTVKGWWDWSQGKEGAEVLGRIGVGMINAGQRGIAPLGAFGEGLGSGLDAKAAFQKSQREQDIERRKMLLQEQAGRIAAAAEDRADLMGPYERQIAQAKIDAAKQAMETGKYIPVDPSKPLLDAKTGKWIMPPGGLQPKPTEAQKALDRQFGKDYAELVTQGGFTDIEKNLNALKSVKRDLEGGKKELTGWLTGRVPDTIQSVLNPAAIDTRDRVQEVVQRNLRLVLGAQFTQVEGENLIKRAYNPLLDEKTNAARLGALVTAMENALKAKKDAAEYFEKHGTLVGYKGAWQIGLGDLENAIDRATPGSGGSASKSTAPPRRDDPLGLR